jgi:hypothetical protein
MRLIKSEQPEETNHLREGKHAVLEDENTGVSVQTDLDALLMSAHFDKIQKSRSEKSEKLELTLNSLDNF